MLKQSHVESNKMIDLDFCKLHFDNELQRRFSKINESEIFLNNISEISLKKNSFSQDSNSAIRNQNKEIVKQLHNLNQIELNSFDENMKEPEKVLPKNLNRMNSHAGFLTN